MLHVEIAQRAPLAISTFHEKDVVDAIYFLWEKQTHRRFTSRLWKILSLTIGYSFFEDETLIG